MNTNSIFDKRVYIFALVLTLCEFAMIQASPIATIYGVSVSNMQRDSMPMTTTYEKYLYDQKAWEDGIVEERGLLSQEKNASRRAMYARNIVILRQHIERQKRIMAQVSQ